MIMNDIINIIKKSSKINITFHTSPDGDALGSALALMQGLKKLGKEVSIICKDKMPEIYSYLPFVHQINSKNSKVQEDVECLIVLDCGDKARISADLATDNGAYTLINIDHHLSNELYGDLNFVDTNASAVGEIVYQIMRLMGIEIDKEMSICLYTSIVTDCGGFKYSNTTSVTHTIAGDLINTGIDFSEIHRILFQNKHFNRVKLYGKVIEKMFLTNEDKLCIMELSNEMLKEMNIEASDTSDIISIGIEIDTVEVCALFKETEHGTKVSLRSKKKVDVRKVAETFGGGGHIRASGLFIEGNIRESKEILMKVLEKELI